MRAGSPEWWEVVQTTEFGEAENMCRAYRVALLAAQQARPDPATQTEITRTNDYIHRFNTLQNKAHWRIAVENLYGPEAVAAIREEMARLTVVVDNR